MKYILDIENAQHFSKSVVHEIDCDERCEDAVQKLDRLVLSKPRYDLLKVRASNNQSTRSASSTKDPLDCTNKPVLQKCTLFQKQAPLSISAKSGASGELKAQKIVAPAKATSPLKLVSSLKVGNFVELNKVSLAAPKSTNTEKRNSKARKTKIRLDIVKKAALNKVHRPVLRKIDTPVLGKSSKCITLEKPVLSKKKVSTSARTKSRINLEKKGSGKVNGRIDPLTKRRLKRTSSSKMLTQLAAGRKVKSMPLKHLVKEKPKEDPGFFLTEVHTGDSSREEQAIAIKPRRLKPKTNLMKANQRRSRNHANFSNTAKLSVSSLGPTARGRIIIAGRDFQVPRTNITPTKTGLSSLNRKVQAKKVTRKKRLLTTNAIYASTSTNVHKVGSNFKMM